MKKKTCAIAMIALWGILTVMTWLLPPAAFSDAERRPLEQRPALSADSILDGSYMKDFESYSLDQFPLRDFFRQLKSLFHYYALNQADNNGIYLWKGYAAQQEYPLKESSVTHALNRFNYLYETYLTGSTVYVAVVPDKGYYMAQESGHLAMDYDRLFAMVREGMPWATHIDLTGALSMDAYYRTDTHWRQEYLLTGAGLICQSMGVTAPKAEEFTPTVLSRPFYGVYYGQAALPMEPETMYLMTSPWLEQCTVYNHETGKTAQVYDMTKLNSKDLYDVFLSGACSLLTIENPNAPTDRELIVFRDSYGSSMIPLLIRDYAKVTVIDIRYVRSDMLDQFVDFHGQDVLFLYGTLVLNNSTSLK